jgi:xylulokinase
MLFLSIDIGTSAVKVAVVDDVQGIRQAATAPYPYLLLPGEKVEIDPEALWAACYRACLDIDPLLRSQVDFLCYDTFSPSPVLVRADGSLAYPNIITHMDRRSRLQSAYIDRVIGHDRYLNIAGLLPFAGGAGAMTFIWLQQNEPGRLKQASRIGHLATYVHHRLTGEWVVDLVNASMTGLYETTTQGGWSDELIDAFGIESRLLGEILEPGVRLGVLQSAEAARLGVRSGIPVSVGTNDIAAAQCGAGNFTAGRIMNVSGSSEMVSILTTSPITSAKYYLRNAAIPGTWQIYATTAGGFALDWFHSQFCQDMEAEEFHDVFVARAIDDWVQDGAVSFEPYLTGDRQSLEVRTAAWHGLTLATTREEMCAAMLKSMNRVLAAIIAEAGRVVSLDPVIKLTGGLSRPSLLDLKTREFPEFRFELIQDCPILGNVMLARRHLDSAA